MKKKKNIAIVAHDNRKKDIIVSSSLFHEDYEPILKDYGSYIKRDVDMN